MKSIVCKIKEFENDIINNEIINPHLEKNYRDYYRLYEYTDDVRVIEDNTLYPGLLNYVKTGLLTKEELIDALEYDKDLEQ